ncbi:histidinol-phosphate transaminase [Paenarthrobacter histidinolovorans]|uniref:Aromatic amino acid aminotransferase n=1 Tax=Paenarthrobacter histidinolovorans TaxID=43664 RepID=A0ABW8MZK2_9MICC
MSFKPDASPLSLPALRPEVASLPAYVPGVRAQTLDTAALASNESHFNPLPSVRQAVFGAAATMNRYPDAASVALRARLAQHLEATPDEIVVGAGSLGVLSQIMSAYCRPGDEVIFPWRSFEAYPLVVQLAGATSVPVPLRPDESHDLDGILAAITNRTRVIIICTPNNPTGVPVPHAELAKFLESVRSDVLVIIDEAYIEYATAKDTANSLALYRQHPNVCLLRTFSKAYGLAGLRIGYALATPGIAEGLRKAGLPFSVSALAQQAAITSLDARAEMLTRVQAVVCERERILLSLRSAGYDIPDSQANFLWLRCGDETRVPLEERFQSAGILVRGYARDGIRISVADAEANNRVINLLAAQATGAVSC